MILSTTKAEKYHFSNGSNHVYIYDEKTGRHHWLGRYERWGLTYTMTHVEMVEHIEHEMKHSSKATSLLAATAEVVS